MQQRDWHDRDCQLPTVFGNGSLQKLDGSGLGSEWKLKIWRWWEWITFWMAMDEKGRKEVNDGVGSWWGGDWTARNLTEGRSFCFIVFICLWICLANQSLWHVYGLRIRKESWVRNRRSRERWVDVVLRRLEECGVMSKLWQEDVYLLPWDWRKECQDG